ncbi:flagellar assembly peptidoglycan hydrolase FlgJ [Shewanella sp. Isolate11]|uniref:flagellar assembly peptidoglycan hydrolase FlgJ n=1 Tax=Shewanella sp. Isolate11 TaxID=2908530 RepID=UPI001EFC4DAA|nr:flagellar assembly peptidoglycan hydrolase FlgJ [Shewanella sp. Isolate11]MCG9697166.1 flagellar assembly peptidoglycan hydrolase FlgJ [Shewanella sp. Isolate11]
MEKLSNSSHFLDLGGLDSLRAKAQKDDKAALKEVAQQFEGIFVQMLMKSMRDANAVFESDSPMNSQYTKFYEQMHDQQMSVNLSDKGMLGLADLMVQQLDPQHSSMTPASVLRGGMSQVVAANSNNDNSATNTHSNLANHKGVLASLSALKVSSSEPTPVFTDVIDAVVSGKVLPSQAPKMGFDSREEFVQTLYPYAVDAAESLGTTPEVLIAQSALETGWGQKMVRQGNGESSNNLFNIKADRRWQGDKAGVSTLEFEQGVAVKQRADFRVYDDLKQSFDDFVSFISEGPRYQDALKQAADPSRFIKGLQQAGYATDPNYADKVMKVMQSLTQDFGSALSGVSQ